MAAIIRLINPSWGEVTLGAASQNDTATPSSTASTAQSEEKGCLRKAVALFFDLFNETVFETCLTGSIIEILAGAQKICVLVGTVEGSGDIPYLSLIASPFHLLFAAKQSYSRFKVLLTAFKARDVVSVFFLGLMSIDSLGSAFGAVSRTFFGGAQFTGIKNYPIFPVIFTKVLPVVMIVFGAIGAIADSWSLCKNIGALRALNKKAEGSDRSFNLLLEALEYLKGPVEETVEGEAPNLRKMAQHKVDRWFFESNHSTSDARFAHLKERIDAFLEDNSLLGITDLQQQVNRAVAPFKDSSKSTENLKKLHDEIVALHQELTNSLEENPALAIKKTRTLLNKVSKLAQEEQFKDFRDPLNLAIKDFETLEGDLKIAEELMQIGRGELHRKLLYRCIGILTSLMSLTAGILIIIEPNEFILQATILSLATSGINVGKYAFDKTISQEWYAKFERIIGL